MSGNWFPTKVYCFHECLLTQFWLFALNISVCTNTEHQGNRYPAARNSASPPETFTQQLNTPGTVTILQGDLSWNNRHSPHFYGYFLVVLSWLLGYITQCSNRVPMMTSSNGNIFRLTGHLCGEFTGAQIPVTRSFDVSLICVWIDGWVNNREAGDLRRYRAH